MREIKEADVIMYAAPTSNVENSYARSASGYSVENILKNVNTRTVYYLIYTR